MNEEELTETAVADDTNGRRRALVFWEGGAATYELPARGTVVVGRDPSCAIRVEHASVSRRHVALHLDTGSVGIEELGSSNGTRVGGHKIARGKVTPLPPGMLVELGLITLIVHGGDVLTAAGAPVAKPADATETTRERLERLVDLVASSRLSVVIGGETGVGKEIVAERIHAQSGRTGPLVKINCAALPEALLEAELFGYERGAFTGASNAKPGLIETADGGSLLLDEIAEMPAPVQAKLLRVLETREAQRLGALAPRKIDVRFIAATHGDLQALTRTGQFRQDLYFRLNGITIVIPPLRDRRDEIAALANLFVAQACREAGTHAVRITPSATARLTTYAWPGNVRELRNVIERAVVLAKGGDVDLDHLHGLANEPAQPVQAPGRQRIIDALTQAAGNQKKAAELLGISRRTLLVRLDEYDIPRPRKERG